MKKLKPELGIVQETLLMPLIGRVEISKKHPDFFKDEKAEEIFKKLDFNKGRARRTMGEAGLLSMAVRAMKLDQAIKDFVYYHPKATILNVGAGLDTAFWRVDNSQIKWIDLDLPDSIALREQFLPPSERNIHLAKSVFDYSWIDDIGDISNGLFIQVPGVFPYIDKATIQEFFQTVPQQLKGAEIIFDVVSTSGRFWVTQAIKMIGMKEAELKWGINNAKEIVKWSDNIEIVKQESYFDNIDMDLRFFPTTNMAMVINKLIKIGQFYHLKFV